MHRELGARSSLLWTSPGSFAKCLLSSPSRSFHSHPCPYLFPNIIRNRAMLGWSGGSELGAAGWYQHWKSSYEVMGRIGASAPTFWLGARLIPRGESTAAAARSAEENNREKHWKVGFGTGRCFVPPSSEGATLSWGGTF